MPKVWERSELKSQKDAPLKKKRVLPGDCAGSMRKSRIRQRQRSFHSKIVTDARIANRALNHLTDTSREPAPVKTGADPACVPLGPNDPSILVLEGRIAKVGVWLTESPLPIPEAGYLEIGWTGITGLGLLSLAGGRAVVSVPPPWTTKVLEPVMEVVPGAMGFEVEAITRVTVVVRVAVEVVGDAEAVVGIGRVRVTVVGVGAQ